MSKSQMISHMLSPNNFMSLLQNIIVIYIYIYIHTHLHFNI